MSKLATQPKGFTKPKEQRYFDYRAEISRRYYQTDDSELFLGELFFSVPEQPSRQATHELAILYLGCWMQEEEATRKGANQAFLFTANSDIDITRIEMQPFEDRDGCQRVSVNESIAQSQNFLSQCRTKEIKWENYAIDLPPAK